MGGCRAAPATAAPVRGGAAGSAPSRLASAAVPPGRPPIALPARPLGNPAADPVVTPLSSVVLELGCCLPGQAGSPCTPPPPPAIPRPPLSRVPVTPALTGARPRAGPLSPSAAATPAIPLPAATGAILPNAVQQSRSSVTRTRPAMPPPTDRDRPCDRHLQRAQGAMRLRFARRSSGGVLDAWQCARRVRRSAGPPDVRPIGGPSWCQGQAADRGRRAGRTMMRTPHAERPSRADDG